MILHVASFGCKRLLTLCHCFIVFMSVKKNKGFEFYTDICELFWQYNGVTFKVLLTFWVFKQGVSELPRGTSGRTHTHTHTNEHLAIISHWWQLLSLKPPDPLCDFSAIPDERLPSVAVYLVMDLKRRADVAQRKRFTDTRGAALVSGTAWNWNSGDVGNLWWPSHSLTAATTLVYWRANLNVAPIAWHWR